MRNVPWYERPFKLQPVAALPPAAAPAAAAGNAALPRSQSLSHVRLLMWAQAVADELEEEFAQELLLRAREVSCPYLHTFAQRTCGLRDPKTPKPQPCSQTHEYSGGLLVSQRREEIDDIKGFISRLHDQRRAAVAMLWDDRTTERLMTNYN